MKKKIVISLISLALLSGLVIYCSQAGLGYFEILTVPLEIHAAFEKWQSEHRKIYNSPAERNYRL